MTNWEIEEKHLILKYNWKISRSESVTKNNFFLKISDGTNSGLGEVAPNIRYGETPQLVKDQFDFFLKNGASGIKSLDDLQNLLNFTQICNSLRFGIESAYIHYLSKIQNLPVYSFLGLDEPKNIFTAYTLPIMQIGEIQSFYEKHQLERFKYLKLKINSENGFDLLKEVRKLSSQSIMIDANESWQNVEELIKFLEKIKKDNIVFVEQPLPYNFEEEYKYLKQNCTFDIFADESITDKADFKKLTEQFHGINMKLMKSGGYLNGIRLLKDAKKHGLKTMIGCMVETSLGISSAMNLCSLTDYNDLDGFFVIDNEPFNLITEKKGQLFYSKT